MIRRIGVLGLGSIGKRHFQNFETLGCHLKGYDSDLADPDYRQEVIDWADAIVIATPTSQHFTDIMTTRKPALVEKPLVATRGELEDVQATDIIMVGYNLRFHSCVKKARAWLGEGLIGKPLWARFTCAQYNDKADYIRDGVTLNWSHEIDLALHLLGHAVMMTAAGDDQRTVDIVLNHDVHHCQTAVHLDYLTKHERRGFLIVGMYGSIEVDLVHRTAICLDNRGNHIDGLNGRDTFDQNYVAEARAFLDRLDGEDVDGCTADEAMQVVNICLLAKENMK